MRSAPLRVPLWRNLLGGLRLLAFMRLDARHFVVSAREIVALLALTTLVWIAFDRLVIRGEDYFAWSGLAQLAWLVLVVAALPFALAALAIACLYRARRFGGDPRVLAGAGAIVTVVATAFVFNATVIVRPTFWYATSKEKAENLTRSKPQIHIGERMRAKLEELPFT